MPTSWRAFHQDGDEATIRFQLKGGRVKTKGLHSLAAQVIQEYIETAGVSAADQFRR
jgi:hypothetical protein